MSSLVLFAIVVAVASTALTAYHVLRQPRPREWLFSRTGKGVLKGIVVATVSVILIAGASTLFASKAKADWFQDGSVYFGLDHTKGTSPQCVTGEGNDKATSNLGLRFNIYESPDHRFRFNTKYTHHSCAFSSDRNGYDAVGIEFEYKFWSR